jgi:hypothetical protein
MNNSVKQTALTILTFLLFVSTKTFSQTYSLNTQHQSIAIEVKNLGFSADIFTTNSHVNQTYDVSYTVEFTLKCGGTKTYSRNTSIKAGKTESCGGYTISIPEVKGCERGISSARLISFSAKPQRQENSTNSNNDRSPSDADYTRSQLNKLINQNQYSEAKVLLENKGHLLTFNEARTYRTTIMDGLNRQQPTSSPKTAGKAQGNGGSSSAETKTTEVTKNTNGQTGNNTTAKPGQKEYDEVMKRLEDDKKKNQVTQQQIKDAAEGLSNVASAIGDGISSWLSRKKGNRQNGYWDNFTEMAAIGYYGGTNSLLGMEVNDIKPSGWGWGINMRVNPGALFANTRVTSTGDYTSDDVEVGGGVFKSWSHSLVNPKKRSSFSVGGHVNRGITHFLFLQLGIGFGGSYTYKVYEVTGTGGYDAFEDEIGKKYWFRKPDDKVVGLTNELGLLLKLQNVMSLKTGVSFYNFKNAELTFGLLLMPNF